MGTELEERQSRFERMFNEVKRLVTNHARGLVFFSNVKDFIEPKDLVQETLLRAWNAFPRYDENRSKFSSWLIVIMTNLFRNKIRDCKKWSKRFSLSGDEGVAYLYENSPSPGRDGPEGSLVSKEIEASLGEAFQTLSDEQRNVFVAIEMRGLKYKEAEELFGIKLGTVKSRLHRAREKLQLNRKLSLLATTV